MSVQRGMEGELRYRCSLNRLCVSRKTSSSEPSNFGPYFSAHPMTSPVSTNSCAISYVVPTLRQLRAPENHTCIARLVNI